IDNIHYVKTGEKLIPAGETEFARDATFGYKNSDLTKYIEEKTRGAVKAEEVKSISIEMLESDDIRQVEDVLNSSKNNDRIIVNAKSYEHMEVFCRVLDRVVSGGKTYMLRTAASFTKVFGGVSTIPLLTRDDMISENSGNGGIVVVGSHTDRTTAQLTELLSLDGVAAVPFDSDKVLEGDDALEQEVRRCVELEEHIISSGKCAVCYTSRRKLVIDGETPESALKRSVRISDAVRELIGLLSVKPSFIVAKGGITSSDVATKALGLKKCRVMGQILPGVPVWETGPESRFQGIPYIIFPGNVGEPDSLKTAVEKLM
ncbi:MAG: hydroxyacid dehydrogenase, partial [Parasporobacterium sp.]|nr:hydroxyacid dehydrogenase [Parasporobacterium sp.]